MAWRRGTSGDAPSDAELLGAARSGDEAAFAALVRRHQGPVGRIAIRMLGAGDEADDVAQEVFIRFHGALAGFRGDAAVGTYVSRIAINLSLNALRRRRWQLRRFLRRDIGEVGQRDEFAREGSDPAEAGELRAMVERALDRLGDGHRAVVVCRLLEGYSTRETAELLGIPEGTVMSRLTRALDRLRRDLEAAGLEAP